MEETTSQHHGSDAGSGGEQRSVGELIEDLYSIFKANTSLTSQRNVSAAKRLRSLRDRFLAGDRPTQREQVLLLCVGIAIQRRAAVIDVGDDVPQVELDLRSSLVVSLTLVFVLIAIVTTPSLSAMEAEGVLNRVEERSLWDVLQCRDGTTTTSDGEVAQSLLAVAIAELGSSDETATARVAERFFRASALEMQSMKFGEFGKDEFLSLSASRFCVTASMDTSDSELLNIVAAAESEAGQSVLRDIMLSFLLPANVVGVRRTLLLSRAASSSATLLYADQVQQAHETAMAGAAHTWNNATDELRRSCVLLAGLACLLTRGGEDPIRKGSAFGGRVQLPFLETPMPKRTALRISLVPSSGLWVLYRLSNEATPEILSSATGLEGLQFAALGIVSDL